MKIYKKIILSLAVVFTTQAVFAQAPLDLAEQADAALRSSKRALTLSDVQKMVVNENLDIKMSYEQLLRAQRKIGVARAQYFPYGLGTVAQFYFYKAWTPLLLIELVTSFPSKFFTVQSERNLRTAQYYSTRALKENIKNEVAKLYYTLLKEDTALKLLAIEISLMEEKYNALEDLVKVGLEDAGVLESVKIHTLDLRDIYLKFKAYHYDSKSAFFQMLAKTPLEGKQLELAHDLDFIRDNELNVDLMRTKENAVAHSNEVMSAKYQYRAARKAKHAQVWSVLSFSGLGFGYWGGVQVAKHKVREAYARIDFVKTTVRNQVYTRYSKLMNSVVLRNSENEIFLETKRFLESSLEQYKASKITTETLLEAQMLYLRDMREMVVSHYDSLIKKEDFNRAALRQVVSSVEVTRPSVDTNELDTQTMAAKENFSLVVKSKRSRKFKISVDTSLLDIDSVEYKFQRLFKPMVSKSHRSNYTIKLKAGKLHSPISGEVVVTLKSGKILTKKFTLR